MLFKLVTKKFVANYRNGFKLSACKFCTTQHRENKKALRIGCASGFWGDTATSTQQLVKKGNLDFLVYDYLSEITMSLLTAAKRKKSDMGYAPDFVNYAIGPSLAGIKEKGIRIVSNAGGTNPHACANALKMAAKQIGLDLDIAVVVGDDMMPKFELLSREEIREMGSCKPLPKSVMSMNAYFGAEPIKKALDLGAEVVITGRSVDSALVLGPLMHNFDWSVQDYGRLAAGSLAGHLLECGAQSTGGVYTDWQTVPDWDDIGFPIAECLENGDFLLTKPESTGGIVTPSTVAEQLVYEIGDPTAYILPDVVCDFSEVNISQIAPDTVWVTGAKGLPPTDSYKVCATYLDGFRLTAVFNIAGKRAIPKGLRTAESIIKRVRRIFNEMGCSDFRRVHIQAVGDEALYGSNARKYGVDGNGPREAMIWMAVEHTDKKALELFAREIAAAGTGMAPGLCGIVGGRPKASPVLKLFSFLYPKKDQKVQVCMEDQIHDIEPHVPEQPPKQALRNTTVDESTEIGNHSFLLEELAYTRSGDKGNNANIGVVARHPSYWPYLKRHLTADVVYDYFRHLFDADAVGMPVTRYELPGVNGFNFVLCDCLDGGGVASLRIDPQGKALGQMLLDIELTNLPDIVSMVKTD